MSDHPEIIEPIKKILEEMNTEAHQVEISPDKTEAVVDLVLSPHGRWMPNEPPGKPQGNSRQGTH